MAIAKDVLDYLTQPENLAFALEISDHMDELKRQTHYDFWVAFNHELQSRLSESDLITKWIYRPFNVERIRSDWNQGYLKPPSPADDASFLQFAIGQASSKNSFPLMWGVLWNKLPESQENISLAKLKKILYANKMTMKDSAPRWPGWNYLPYTPFTHSFIFRMCKERDTLIGEVTDVVWKGFLELQSEMSQINQSVLLG